MRGDRYRAEGPEAEYEPGSRGRVLRNLLGIRSIREMAERESAALVAATLDFGGIRGETKQRYILAVHAALGRDYRPMTEIFRGVIARTLRAQASASSAKGRS